MLCAGLLVAGCSQNDVTSTEPQAFTVSATPVLPRIPSGESADIVVSATRGSGTSGPVVFSFVGEPQGVTVTWSPQQVSGSVIKSIATVLVDTSVAAGSYEFRVYARTDAAIADAGVGLVVLGGPPDFTLAANPDTVSIIPGGLWTVQVDVAAVDFQGEKVHLELLNPPPGVSARFTPDSVSGGHSTLILSVAPSAPAGSYGLTVQGSGTGLPVRSVPLALTVSDAPSGLSVNLDVSQCSEANRPTWLAVQDGVGNPWIALAAASGVYQASFSQPNVGIAYTVGGSQPGLVVSYLTREEAVAAQPYRFCHKPASRSVT
ncbi:MAG TPA: hypothetical protein VFU23_00845, partial [Gemmatimonadales bacterium]|nr:hypothetical protein [Gemmatimonadales bacterium]